MHSKKMGYCQETKDIECWEPGFNRETRLRTHEIQIQKQSSLTKLSQEFSCERYRAQGCGRGDQSPVMWHQSPRWIVHSVVAGFADQMRRKVSVRDGHRTLTCSLRAIRFLVSP